MDDFFEKKTRTRSPFGKLRRQVLGCEGGSSLLCGALICREEMPGRLGNLFNRLSFNGINFEGGTEDAWKKRGEFSFSVQV